MLLSANVFMSWKKESKRRMTIKNVFEERRYHFNFNGDKMFLEEVERDVDIIGKRESVKCSIYFSSQKRKT